MYGCELVIYKYRSDIKWPSAWGFADSNQQQFKEASTNISKNPQESDHLHNTCITATVL